MIERPVGATLLALPFLYVAVVVLPVFPASTPGVAAAFFVSLLIAALTSLPSPRSRDLGAWVGIVLSLFFALTVWEPGTFGDTSAGLAVGVLLGLPWIAWVYVWRVGEPFANRLIAYALALTVGVLLLGTLSALGPAGTSVTPDSFVSGFYTLNIQQLQGIATLLSGAGGASLPAHDLFDATYAGLTGVGTLGLIVIVLRPHTADDRALPITFSVVSEESTPQELSPLLGFSEAQRTVFRQRSMSQAPASAAPPGLAAVLGAAIATVAFLAVAFLLPYWALLGATGGLAVAAGLLVTLSDVEYRPTTAPRPGVPPETPRVVRAARPPPATLPPERERPAPGPSGSG
jgi:hypothetical protein